MFWRGFLVALILFVVLPDFAPAVSPDDSPLLYSAQSQLRNGEYSVAADAFAKVLEINPGDSRSWIFYAQALAGQGLLDSAFTCLTYSLECGLPDSATVAGLEEFAELASSERFVSLTTAMAEKQRNRPHRIYLPQTRVTWCEVEYPAHYDSSSGETWPMILYLHGGGRDMDHGREIASKIGFDNAIRVFTDAPYSDTRVAGQYNFFPGRFRDPAIDRQATSLSAGWFGEVAQTVMEQLPVDPERVAVVGFSQGAAWTWAAAIIHPEIFTCAAPLSGWIPASLQDSTDIRVLADNDVSLFVGTGRQDRYFTPERVGGYVETATDAGVDVEFHTFDAGHELTDEYAAAVRVWLEQQFGE